MPSIFYRMLLCALVALGSLSTQRAASAEPAGLCVQPTDGWAKSAGPDVIVGTVVDARLWGTSSGIAAYSIGTIACNAGDHTVSWLGQSNLHPVVSQALYRLGDQRMEQIGMSWLKHGFIAGAENVCGFGCQDPGTFSLLGVGCSDPYEAILNGEQRALGPRSDVNAATGAFTYPFPTQNVTGDVLYKRLQVQVADLLAASNPGARYFAEGQYVTADDAAAGNDTNNASYREISFDPALAPTLLGTTQRERSAIEAWRDVDPSVVIANADVPADGRFKLAAKVTDLGGGTWHYEYALNNMNSHRSARSFAVPIAPGTVVENVGFYDVDYHSGEPYDDADWESTVSAGAVTWETDNEALEPNANALRFATTYNFWFDASRPPVTGPITVELFRAGSPAAITILGPAPSEESILPLVGGRFQVEAVFRTPQGQTGNAHPVQLTDNTGTFWFFNPNNLEVMLKVLNGCASNQHYWVFAAGLTNVEMTITVTDTQTGHSKTYTNPLGTPFQPIQDTGALACN